MRAWRCAAVAALYVGASVSPAAAQPAPPALAVPSQAPPPVALPIQPPLPGPGQMAPPGLRVNWDQLGLRGFSVALVVGDLAGVSAPDNLPAGAKKALSDMRDFLPYKSYRLLDTHWILCCSGNSGHATVSGRLRGAEEEEYVFYIQVRPGAESQGLGVTFTLREAGAKYADAGSVSATTRADRSRQLAELRRQREDSEKRYAEARQKYAENNPERQAAALQLEDVKRKLAELEYDAQPGRATSRAGGIRQVLDSTFSMKVGETVVIGTSRLKGDKALIALLTAASRGAAPTRESRD
jgi:hypothetical protein